MSQKNETAVLALALLLTAGLAGGGIWWFANSSGVKFGNTSTQNQEGDSNPSMAERISFGKRTLTQGDVSLAKKDGVQAIADKSYDQAIRAMP